ncbi:DegV family protein [Dehalogenimonas sp. 4OHTPN]|uniref:DegV family protein n=1 Tax=Dehalogenimonas sp. 4OHTPN TaxID=3166643 RepID=A0AAU8GB56_9CHLR
MAVKVVTDSTCDLPPEVARDLGIAIVPIYVRFGAAVYRDGVDITPGQLYPKLIASDVHPATSQPTPEDFAAVYKEASRDADAIVSVHISSRISGTFNSAVIAAKAFNGVCPVEVVDSRFNSAGLGLAALAAARAAKSGAGLAEVLAETNLAISQVRMFGLFRTMKYLARSGRINKAVAAASSVLNVMPLLTFHDGEIARAGLVRTVGRGMEKIIEFVRKHAPVTEITVVHSRAAEEAEKLRGWLAEFLNAEKIMVSELGAGLGVHGGPGVLLIGLRRAG